MEKYRAQTSDKEAKTEEIHTGSHFILIAIFICLLWTKLSQLKGHLFAGRQSHAVTTFTDENHEA